MENTVKLAAISTENALEKIRSLRERNLPFHYIKDYRPGAKGEEFRAAFFSIYKFKNAGGRTSRLVVHERGGYSIPMIVKVDSAGDFAIDVDCALHALDCRKTTRENAYKNSEYFSNHPDLEYEDEDAVIIPLDAQPRVRRDGGEKVISVEIPV